MRNPAAIAAIPVTDIGRARKYYEEQVGLSVREERPDGVTFDVGGSSFFVYESAFAGTNQATAMALKIDDFDHTVNELIGRGVTFEQYDLPGLKTDERGIAEHEAGRAAWFKDPDGNIIAIDQR